MAAAACTVVGLEALANIAALIMALPMAAIQSSFSFSLSANMRNVVSVVDTWDRHRRHEKDRAFTGMLL
jgi:hypothetical protein